MAKALDPSTPLEEIVSDDLVSDTWVELVPLSSIEPQSVEWLWPGRIALGKVTLLCGNPGLGKTFLTLDAAGRVSNGLYWPDGTGPAPLGEVVILSGEDGAADTIRPRLDAISADVERIFILDGVRSHDEEGKPIKRQVNLKRDVEHLRKMLQSRPEIRLVIIDPISQYLGNVDSHKNAEVRSVLGPLGELAEEFNVAILSVTHLSKGVGPAIYRAMGSLAFVAQARAAFAIVKSPTDEELRFFLPIKNNLASKPDGLAYRIVDGRMVWSPDPVAADVDELVSPSSPKKSSGGKLDEAVEWMRERLQDESEIESETFREEMEQAGITFATFKRAKASLKLKSRKGRGQHGRWMVSLLKVVPDAPVGPLEPLETLGWSDPAQESQPNQESQEERREPDGPSRVD